MITLKNKFLQVKLKETGSELTSIIANGKEYLWQGSLEYWTGQAPILFPFIGRLKNDFYIFENKKYTLPQHGFYRKNKEIKHKKTSETKCDFSLKSNPQTKSVYPFEFDFRTSYELEENKVVIRHEVENIGSDTLYFSLGEHPAFNCSLVDKKAKHNQCYLEFEKEETAAISLLTKEGYISSVTLPYLKKENKIELPEAVFVKDALVFKQMNSKEVTLVNKTEGKLVTVRYKNFPNLGIWSKPMAPYVCIEPWLGYADAFNSNQQLINKEGIIPLEKGATYSCSFSIEIH